MVEMGSLDTIAKMFVSEVSLGKSVDWYLIKLSGVITYLKDSYGRENLPEILEEFLNIDIVTKALEPLACHADVVEKIITENPRFSDLRPYSHILISALGRISCRDVGLTTNVREPTFKVESKSVESSDVEVKARRKYFHLSLSKLSRPLRRSLIDVLIVISVALVMAYAIYLILHQRGLPFSPFS
ncbi:MAG: hypothetical protein QXR55_05545 [Sulfolobales archaeon]